VFETLRGRLVGKTLHVGCITPAEPKNPGSIPL
jgi:hypothetical protein